MVSLPVGGMITRIACGSTMRRIVWRRVMPSACAASVWPSSTEMIPARTISAMYAASFSPRPRMAATNGVITEFELKLKNSGPPNGIPIEITGWRAGTARISSGGPPGSSAGVAPASLTTSRPLALGSVYHRRLDRAGLDPPLLEDRLVLAARDQLLHRREHWLLKPALLRDRD